MTRTLLSVLALASLLVVVLPAPPALALDEAERLWLVGEQASADGLHALARRVLERFLAEYPSASRRPPATLLVGRARLALATRTRRSTPSVDFVRWRRPLSGSRDASGKPRRSTASSALPRRALAMT